MANTTWNPADKSANMTLSNGNLTATSTNWQVGVRAVLSQSSGKYYFEATPTVWNGTDGIGLALASYTFGTAAGNTGSVAVTWGGTIWINNVNSGSTLSGATSNGVTFSTAVDLTARLIWFRVAPSGQWNASGTANPATAAGGLSISGLSGALFPFYGTWTTTGSSVTANFGDSAFSGAVPSGFSAGWPGTAGAGGTQARVMVMA